MLLDDEFFRGAHSCHFNYFLVFGLDRAVVESMMPTSLINKDDDTCRRNICILKILSNNFLINGNKTCYKDKRTEK